MKKFLSFAFLIVLCLPILLFAGCKTQQKDLNLDVYFDQQVKYTIYGKNEEYKDQLSNFTDNRFNNHAQFTKITLEGKSDWLYKMTIEKIEFQVSSNMDEELQFIVRISNLRNTDKDQNQNPKFVQSVVVKTNKTQKVSIPVKDYFESISSEIKVEIELDGTQYYFSENQNTGLKIDISAIKVFGEHDLSKTK